MLSRQPRGLDGACFTIATCRELVREELRRRLCEKQEETLEEYVDGCHDYTSVYV